MLLTAHASNSSTGQSNMRPFKSSLAINPTHVLTEEVNKSTRNRNALNFCLLLASLGKFNKVNCPSFTQKKHHWSHLEQSADSNP